MNILQLDEGYEDLPIPPEKISSIDSVMFNISKCMVEMGHEVTILKRKVTTKVPTTKYVEGINIVQLNVRTISSNTLFARSLNGISFAVEANRFLRANINKFDVVHAHRPIASNILVALNRGLRKKMFYTVHYGEWMLGLSASSELSRALPFYLRAFSPILHLARRVRKVIVLNDEVRIKLVSAKNIEPQKVVTIPLGVDTKLFNPNVDVTNIKKRYGLEGKTTILFIGGMWPRKGVKYLIKSANIIVNELDNKDILFLLVSGPPVTPLKAVAAYYVEILNLIKCLNLEGNVKVIGPLDFDELKELYVACDMFALPSLEEPFGLVLTEAMASGKPVIGTKVGGILMQIKDGWNGFLVKPADHKQLAEKIMYLIENSDERVRMGKNGRMLAEREFDWRIIAEKYIKNYEKEMA